MAADDVRSCQLLDRGSLTSASVFSDASSELKKAIRDKVAWTRQRERDGRKKRLTVTAVSVTSIMHRCAHEAHCKERKKALARDMLSDFGIEGREAHLQRASRQLLTPMS